MKNSQRDNIIARLEKCRDNNEEFYKRHSDLLEELNYKINALKNDVEYEVKDAGWVVGYVGGKIRETNFKYNNGKKIIIVYGSTGEMSVRMNAPEAIVRGYKNYDLAYKALKSGEADAMIADDTILYNLALDDPSVRILDKRFSHEPYAIAFRKGEESVQLKETVNFTLNLMSHSGKLRELKSKWGLKQ